MRDPISILIQANVLIACGQHLRKLSNLDDAARAFTVAADLHRVAGGDPLQLLYALSNLGDTHIARRRLTLARSTYEEVVDLCRSYAEKPHLARALYQLGNTHRQLGNFHASWECLEESVALYEASPEAPLWDYANAVRAYAKTAERISKLRISFVLWQLAMVLYGNLCSMEATNECVDNLDRLRRYLERDTVDSICHCTSLN